jgi:uncharacterized membrane protein (DUF4010 family)
LIGLERGWQQRGTRAGGRVAGLRTYGLIGLLGGLAGLLGARQPLVAAVLAAGAVAVLIIDFRRADQLAARNVSATSEIAALVTFALGVLATSGFAVVAMAVAAVAALLLSQRDTLHGWLHGLSETDVDAVIRFAIIAGAIWPVLPDRAMGPYGAWNPFDLWLVVVIVCGFSFAGYIAAKRFGATRGTLATAAIGGLYSSTAVTASLAQRLRGEAEQRPVLAAGIAVASAVMFARVLALTALLVPFALPRLALIVVPATLVALGFAGLGVRAARAAPPSGAQDARNPAGARLCAARCRAGAGGALGRNPLRQCRHRDGAGDYRVDGCRRRDRHHARAGAGHARCRRCGHDPVAAGVAQHAVQGRHRAGDGGLARRLAGGAAAAERGGDAAFGAVAHPLEGLGRPEEAHA